MVSIYTTATEYLANEITILRGSVDDVVGVGVYHNVSPAVVPTVNDFTMVSLVDGTAEPPDSLSELGKIDVLSLVGGKVGADLALTAGDYQRWVLIQTASEDIIRSIDTVTVQ
jgi:hypothetical protein